MQTKNPTSSPSQSNTCVSFPSALHISSVVHNPMSHNFQALLLHSLQLMNDILSSTNTKQQPRTSMTSSTDSAADTRGMAALHALPFSLRFVGVLLQHVYDTGCSSSTLITLFQLNETQEQQLQQLQAQAQQQQQSRRQFQQQHLWGGGMDGGGESLYISLDIVYVELECLEPECADILEDCYI